MTDVRATVFDIGGTLWFEARRPLLDTVFALQAERVAPLLREWNLTLPVPIEAVMADVWDAAGTAIEAEQARGGMREVSLPFLIRGAVGVRGVNLTPEQAEAWHRAAWIGSMPYMGMQLYPDTLDVLDELERRAVALAINTNRPCTGETFLSDLEACGLRHYFLPEAVVCSGDTGFCKPHPSTFERVLNALGLPPEQVVMVGDSCEADMAGAKPLGMRTVLKRNGRYDAPPCPDADFEIHDLAELLALPLFALNPVTTAADSPTPHEDGNAERY